MNRVTLVQVAASEISSVTITLSADVDAAVAANY
jgi:hypothetical protein